MPYSKQKAKEYSKEYYRNNRQKIKEQRIERLNSLTDAEREQKLQTTREANRNYKQENRDRTNELSRMRRQNESLEHRVKRLEQLKEWRRKHLVCVKDESPEDRAQRLASTRQLMKQWEEERNQAQTTQSMDQDNQPKP